MNKNFPENNPVTKREFNLSVNDLRSGMNLMKRDMGVMKGDIDVMKKDINILKKSVLSIESKINIYSDMYEISKWNSEKLANRVSKLEKHNGIVPPDSLLVSGI